MELCVGCQWDLGSFADWVSGIGTMAAVWVGVYQWNHDRTKGQDRSERDQASKVVFWIARKDAAGPNQEFRLHVRNGSDLPIYDVAMNPNHMGNLSWPAIGPQESLPESRSAEVASMKLNFRDAAGIRWQRDLKGTLTKIVAKNEDLA